MITSQIVNGLMLGSLYALITLGYALILGILRIFNMAQAEVFTLGAVLGWLSITVFKLPPSIALPISIIGGALLGLITEFFCVRRSMAGGSHFVPIAMTIALGGIMTNLMSNFAGTNPLPILIAKLHSQINIGIATIPLVNLIVFNTSLVILALLAYYLKRHPLGMATRAVGENMEVSQLLGINAKGIIQLTFAISGSISAVAGLLFGLMTAAAHPYMGEVAGLKGICLVIIGGMGSMAGAVIAAFIGGVVEVLTGVYWSVTYVDGVLWFIMFLILLFRPTGLMGTVEELERLQ
ncbi:MAG: branched-chain amino acid ABC transporter permease [bacterium]|nr:branched-chain amino acid ABC transporter permease [bacterium]